MEFMKQVISSHWLFGCIFLTRQIPYTRETRGGFDANPKAKVKAKAKWHASAPTPRKVVLRLRLMRQFARIGESVGNWSVSWSLSDCSCRRTQLHQFSLMFLPAQKYLSYSFECFCHWRTSFFQLAFFPVSAYSAQACCSMFGRGAGNAHALARAICSFFVQRAFCCSSSLPCT